MLLKSLKLNNFLSHTETELSFQPDRKVLLDGPSGAGKTTLVEAIVWNLFGHGRMDNRSLIKHGKQTAKVELELTDGTMIWRIRRSVNKKGIQSLDISLEDKEGKAKAVGATSLKEKQEYIEKEILHCSYELFLNAVIYPQDNTNNFVNQTAARRKELLLEMVGAGNFEELSEKAKLTQFKVETDQAKAEIEAGTLTTAIQADKDEVEAFSKIFFDVKAYEEKIALQDTLATGATGAAEVLGKEVEALVSKIAATKSALEEHKNLVKELSTLPETDLKPITKELQTLEWGLEEIAKDRKEYNDLAVWKEIVTLTNNRKAQLEAELKGSPLSIWDDRIKEANKKLIELLSAPGNMCPNTGKVCIKAQAMVEARQKELEGELNHATLNFNLHKTREFSITEELKTLAAPAFDEERFKLLKSFLDEETKHLVRKTQVLGIIEASKQANERRAVIARRLSEINVTADHTGNEEAELEKKRKEFKVAQNLIIELTDSRRKLEFELFVWATKAAEIEVKKKKVKEATERINILAHTVKNLQVDVENVGMVRDALGANGIKVVIVETVLPRLEQRINEILAELSDFRVKLDTQKSSVTDEDKKIEGLFITLIGDTGEEQDYSGFSGGERVKITIAITEALAELQKSEFRILDEAITALDQESVGRFTEVLLKIQERYSQLLVISHIPEVKSLFDDKITVIKKDGTSTVT